MLLIPVILSGGIGSRLWPLSRAATPKQLQRVLGGETMIQATATRLDGIHDVGAPIVVCGARHPEVIRRQLEDVGKTPQLTISEPVGRNTAPAVLLAALTAPPGSALLVLPADHVVADSDAFAAAVDRARPAVAAGSLVTFGIVPHRPETGYGYIEIGEAGGAVVPVRSFVEKPDVATAERYVKSGRYLWNSGMFAFRADVAIDEIRRHAPDVYAPVEASIRNRAPGDRIVPTLSFANSPSISFDHAVMEHTDRAVVVPLDAGWSDVGSWATLWEIEDKDADGNVVRGDAVVVDVTGSYVRSDGRLVAVVGLDDVVVVDTGDAVLVAARDRVQDVKAVVARLTGRPEIDGEPHD
jgi:mannose-1-phosphate guanylyltransferase/mannose-6-phosphate isomerase